MEAIMVRKCLRTGLLVATLVGSLQVAAAPRFWTLTGVQFDADVDGPPVTGYFSYDDVTNTVSNWNVRVEGRWGGCCYFFPALTYLPGNSTASAERFPLGGQRIHLASAFVAPGFDVPPVPLVRTLTI